MIYLGNTPVGETHLPLQFSKYEKVTATFPDAKNTNGWNNGAKVPVSFEPKAVIFYGGEKRIGNIICGAGIFNYEDRTANDSNCGSISCLVGNSGNNQYRYAPWTMYKIDGTNHSAAAARAQFYNGHFQMTRYANNTFWSTTDTYTFEFFG